MRIATLTLVLALAVSLAACGGDAQRSGEVDDVAQGELHFLGEGEFIDSKPITGSEASFTSVRGGLPGVVGRADAMVVVEILDIVDVTVPTIPAPPNWPTAEIEFRPLTTYSGRVEQWLKGSGPDEVLITGFGGITESGANFVDGDFLLDPGRRYVLALYEKSHGLPGPGQYERAGLGLGAFEVTDGFVHVLNNPLTEELRDQFGGMPVDDFVSVLKSMIDGTYVAPATPAATPAEQASAGEGNEPHGNLSVDASPGDNTASSVGPIGDTADVTDSPGLCPGPGCFYVELVIGNHGGGGAIPDGQDIGGWQARIVFDPSVLKLVTFSVKTCGEEWPPTAEYYMEKASPCSAWGVDEHTTVIDPPPAPGVGDYVIGSTVVGTPPGAKGVGRIARLTFDAVSSDPAGTCIDIGDTGRSFYADTLEPGENHNYAERNSAGLSVNGGTAPASCPQPPTPTPTP